MSTDATPTTSTVTGAGAGTATGTVTEFDDPKGWGTVTAADGAELFFHCSAIADGTRSIEVGTAVTFAVVPGNLGRWEAAAIAARS
jgi:CspA family cold shock protein